MSASITGSMASRADQYRDDPEYELQRLLLQLNERIIERMDSQGIRRIDLARRLGVSRAWVTRMLEGNENLTLRTLVKVANALWTKVDIEIVPRHVAYVREGNMNAVRNFGEGLRLTVVEGLDEGEQSALAA